jgi:hypothetical protein
MPGMEKLAQANFAAKVTANMNTMRAQHRPSADAAINDLNNMLKKRQAIFARKKA